MDRLNRLIGIVLLLQSRQVVRAEDVAKHFGISVRTAYRDMRALDEAGVPIAAEAGQGYSLVDGYHLPPVIFTREEASAISIGEMFVERFTDNSLQRHMESALAKIRAVLPPSTRSYVEQLKQATSVLTPFTNQPPEVCATLVTIQDALVGRTVLRVAYYASYRDSVDTREVEPVGMLYYAGNWHLIAYCRLREAIRDFRIDRIRSVAVTGETFTARNEFSLDNYLDTFYCDRNPSTLRVEVRFTTAGARHAGNRQSMGLVQERNTPDGVEMTFMVHSLRRIAGWILSHGPEATVLYPDELRDIVCSMARSVAEQYEMIA